MLPKSVVNKLAAGDDIAPELHEAVTVYFSDIEGFEDLATKSSPIQIVDMLNTLYK